MCWYNTDGAEAINVLWSRVRIYRNIENLKFNVNEDQRTVCDVIKEAKRLLEANGFHSSEVLNDENILSYAEQGYIDNGFLRGGSERALMFNEPCSLSISLGGFDSFCIQSLLCGNAIDEAYKISSEAEALLDNNFSFAYSPARGYLSPFPTHSGHGVEFSVALYLPGIAGVGEIKKIKRRADAHSIKIYPMYTYSQNAGNYFIVDYIPAPSMSIQGAKEKIIHFIKYLISLEKEYECNVFGNNNAVINKAWRSIGIMEYCSSCGEEELLSILSDIRLALSIGCGDSLPFSIDIKTLNTLYMELMNTYIYASEMNKPDSLEACERLRAVRLNSFVKKRKAI